MPARHSTTSAICNLETLSSTGIESYHHGRHSDCVRLLNEFETEAKGHASPASLADARFWRGTSLHATGRLGEAQGVLATAFANPYAQDTKGGFMALTRHLLISAELPLPSTEFLEELARVELRAQETRYRGHSSRILHVRSCLEFDRGNLKEARVLAEQALGSGEGEKATFSNNALRRNIVGILLASGEMGEARRHLENWAEEARREAKGRYARSIFNAARANVTRHEGRPEEAVEWALLANLDAYQSEDYVSWISAGIALVRALLATRRPHRARRPLAEILRLRRSELSRDRYRLCLLHADFHLAMARALVGLHVLDFETGRSYAAADRERDRAAAGDHLAKAEQGCQRALLAGRRVDRLLSCNMREQEMKARIAIVPETRARIA